MKAIVQVPFKGAPDGELHGMEFVKGDMIQGDLARVAVEQKWAIEQPNELPLGRKDAGAAPENKAQGNAPENKAETKRKSRHTGL